MKLAQIFSMALIVVGLLTTYFILKCKKIKLNNLTFKIVSLILAVVFFFRFMWDHDALEYIYHLVNSPVGDIYYTATSLILNWALYSVVLAVILYPFFATSKWAMVVKYYGLIVSVACMIMLPTITLGIVGAEAYVGFNIRTLLMGIELGILFSYCVVVFVEDGYFKVKPKDLWGLLYIIGMLLATMPGYMLIALFGESNYMFQIKKLTQAHRLVLYGSIVLPVVLYFLLHKKDPKITKGILLYICLGTLLSFSATKKFPEFANITGWPLHLCNTAMYLLPLCLIFNLKKLFYFTYFINVFGALTAMLMPNYDAELNFISFRIVNFYINHYIAFFMPLLIVALRVFKRPTVKEFRYSIVGFAMYFGIVLIANAWFSNYGSVDYFFVNSDYVADKLGTWAENIYENNVWSFNIGELTFTFHPLYQFLFFLTYIGLGLGMWFIYEQCYAVADVIVDINSRNRKIKMDRLALEISKLEKGDRQMTNAKAKLELIDFSKRYGTSKSYAVQNANLEINGGEIFGFLGHNGAGKSTIIKSIVGIQPITSGTIKVCGYDVDKESVMAKLNVGFVPDHYALYEKLTGREYINYIADLYDVSKEDRNKSIENM